MREKQRLPFAATVESVPYRLKRRKILGPGDDSRSTDLAGRRRNAVGRSAHMHDRSCRMPATANRAIVTSAWVRFCCGRSRILLMKRCWSRGDRRASAVVHVHRELLAPNRGDVAQTEPRDRSGASLPTLDPSSIVRTHHWRRSDSLIDAPRFCVLFGFREFLARARTGHAERSSWRPLSRRDCRFCRGSAHGDRSSGHP